MIELKTYPDGRVLWCSDWARIGELVAAGVLEERWEGEPRTPWRSIAHFVVQEAQECGLHGWWIDQPKGCPMCLERDKELEP